VIVISDILIVATAFWGLVVAIAAPVAAAAYWLNIFRAISLGD